MTTPISLRLGITKNYNFIVHTHFYSDQIVNLISLYNYLNYTFKERSNTFNIKKNLNKTEVQLVVNPPFISSETTSSEYNNSLLKVGKIFVEKGNQNNMLFSLLSVAASYSDIKEKQSTFKQKYIQVHPDYIAQFVSEYISYMFIRQIKKKKFFNSLKNAIEKRILLESNSILGYCIKCSGPFKGSSRSETKWIKQGQVSATTIESRLGYGFSVAHTLYGTFGIKVWICVKNVKS